MPCVDCPALGDIAAVIGLAILVAAAAAWLTGNWLKTRFLVIALCVAFAMGDGSQKAMRNRRLRGNHRGRRATEQRDELAPLHSITSSARASRFGGTSSPSVLAVLRLMTNSNLVGCWTGRSAGLAPLRMRPTYEPATRY